MNWKRRNGYWTSGCGRFEVYDGGRMLDLSHRGVVSVGSVRLAKREAARRSREGLQPEIVGELG